MSYNSIIQAIVDKAYNGPEHEQACDDQDPELFFCQKFLNRLPTPYRESVVIGWLNHQVENGGFYQWVENGYDHTFSHLLEALQLVGTPTASRVANIVCTVLTRKSNYKNGRPYYDEDENPNEKENRYVAGFERLDEEYYQISQQLLDDAALKFASDFIRSSKAGPDEY